MESTLAQVVQKYESLQELFTTLINEMQVASDCENEERRLSGGEKIMVKRVSPESVLDPKYRDAMSTQMSQGSPAKVEGGEGHKLNLKIEGGGDSSYSNSVLSSSTPYKERS